MQSLFNSPDAFRQDSDAFAQTNAQAEKSGAALGGVAAFFQAFGVAGQFGDIPEATGQAFEKLAMEVALGRREPVVHPQAFLAGGNEPGLSQVRQMARDGRLRSVDDPDQVANAQFARSQQIENAQTSPIRESSKHGVHSNG
jgi:hypothetical protein